jgi:hypothetical protein
MIIYFTAEKKKLKGQVVSPSTPQKEADLYWGYNVCRQLTGNLHIV